MGLEILDMELEQSLFVWEKYCVAMIWLCLQWNSQSNILVRYGEVLTMVLSCLVDGCVDAQEEDDELGSKSSSHFFETLPTD